MERAIRDLLRDHASWSAAQTLNALREESLRQAQRITAIEALVLQPTNAEGQREHAALHEACQEIEGLRRELARMRTAMDAAGVKLEVPI